MRIETVYIGLDVVFRGGYACDSVLLLTRDACAKDMSHDADVACIILRPREGTRCGCSGKFSRARRALIALRHYLRASFYQVAVFKGKYTSLGGGGNLKF